MRFFNEIIGLFLHLDKHLSAVIQQFGPWTYGLLFLIIFSETGLVGLLAYLGMFFIMMRDFFRRRAVAAASGTAVERIQSGLVFVMPVAYLVQGIAIFDVLPMYVPLFLFLAFASFYVAANNHHESHA